MNDLEKKLYESYVDMSHDDMTFCANMCNDFDCQRHECHIRHPERPHSMAYLYGTSCCIYDQTGALKSNVEPNRGIR